MFYSSHKKAIPIGIVKQIFRGFVVDKGHGSLRRRVLIIHGKPKRHQLLSDRKIVLLDSHEKCCFAQTVPGVNIRTQFLQFNEYLTLESVSNLIRNYLILSFL